MRLIPDEALDLIAGGYDDIPVVTIVGTGGGGGYFPWIGGQASGDASRPVASQPVSQPDSEPPTESPPVAGPTHSSPVPHPYVPIGVDMNKLRNLAVELGQTIGYYDKDIEHGSLIIRMPDGQLKATPIAHGTANQVIMPWETKPGAGEMIVGYIHSHPQTDFTSQRLPSKQDFETAADLRKRAIADSHLMLYIRDNEPGHVFEYHAGMKSHHEKEGANISTDMSRPFP